MTYYKNILAVLLIIFNANIIYAEANNYVKKTIYSIPYEKIYFGYDEGMGGFTKPLYSVSDDGEIYLFQRELYKCKPGLFKIGPTGNLVVISTDVPSSITVIYVNKDGKIYLESPYTNVILDPNGNVLKMGKSLVNVRNKKLYDDKNNVDVDNEFRIMKRNKLTDKNKNEYSFERDKKHQYVKTTNTKGGVKTLKRDIEKGIFNDLDELHYFHIDDNGNLYGAKITVNEISSISMRGSPPKSHSVKIYKYDKNGNCLFVVQYRIFISVFSDDQYYQIDRKGNIYILDFKADHLDVVKYELQATE
ncbi:MAG: hypothetical protein A2252_05765 [Elusimicrobia bacterium RIFOXYA2_FULL_39_19]|nr:MAG: hypothetical protein A2252_05765 [Elusimicrobia bacterium RIFOXYA2_FULL_39_19]